MLTIAGSGINYYSLVKLSKHLDFDSFDCVVTDKNFETEENIRLFAPDKKPVFLSYKEIKSFIKEKFTNNKNILYIVTGSPLFFSATNDVLNYLKSEVPDFDENNVNILPAESSKEYLLRKLKIADNDLTYVSLHGRTYESIDLTKFLVSKYTFVLCDEKSVEIINDLTSNIQEELGFYLGAKLGSEQEVIRKFKIPELSDLSAEEIKEKYSPFVILIEKKFESGQSFSENQDFVTRSGMITKSDKRALTLQALELRPNLLMWDIGAGSGSVSIDAAKIFKIRSVLFEKNQEQCGYIKENLRKHKSIGLKLVEGNFLEAGKDIQPPDRIFIGGGGEEVLKELPYLFDKLKDNGILVANIIGLENLTTAVETLRSKNIGFEIRSIDISNYRKIAGANPLTIPEPERTLFQIKIKKVL